MKIEVSLKQACTSLFKNQPNLYSFTSLTGQTEWNLTHHLSNEIRTFFEDYDCDLDISKRNLGNKRPDIVIHKRDSNTDNLLVVEVKRNGKKSKINDDIKKIKIDWFNSDLSYHFGATINLKDDMDFEVKVFENK